MAEAYPLSWPLGVPREHGTEVAKFKTNSTKAHAELCDEVRRMGGTNLVISSNVPIADSTGKMMMGREPVDGGVAIYFKRNGKDLVFACDRFDTLMDNMLSIARTIGALRGIERWGASDMMERAFAGFKALASDTAGESWWSILKCDASASRAEIESAYKAQVRACHPDAGGSTEAMTKLNIARDQALQTKQLS